MQDAGRRRKRAVFFTKSLSTQRKPQAGVKPLVIPG